MDITQPEMLGILFVFVVTVLLYILVKLFDRMDIVKRERRGFDVGWIVIIAVFVCVILAGVLKNKGVL